MKYPQAPRIRLAVTKKHIEAGVRNSSGYCMVAEALKDELKKPEWTEKYGPASAVLATQRVIRFSWLKKQWRLEFTTPAGGSIALAEFDAGISPDPWQMVLKNGHITKAGTPPRVKVQHAERKAANQAATKIDVLKKKVHLGNGRVVGGTRPKLTGRQIANRVFGSFAASKEHKKRLAAVAQAHAQHSATHGT